MKKGIRKKVLSVATATSVLFGIATMNATANAYNSRFSTDGPYYQDNGFTTEDYYNRYNNYPNNYYDYNNYNNYSNYNNYNNYNNDYNNGYNNGYNYNQDEHINVDINDPVVLERYLQAHKANCTDYECQRDNHVKYMTELVNGQYNNNGNYYYDNNYNNNVNPNYNYPQEYPNYNPNQQYNNWNTPTYIPENNYQNVTPAQQQPIYEVQKLYTFVKYDAYGNKVYAYGANSDLNKYGFTGWILNSEYNANDYNLNSVFYEEKYHFGNNFDWNSSLVEFIKQTSGLYVWTYKNQWGETKYCLSPIKMPNNNTFVYNSDFNPVNDLSELKTADAVYNQGYSRTYGY